MPAIMADHDMEGQVWVLLRLLTSAAWSEVWHELAVRVESFASLGLPENTSDAALWQLCQTQQIILITDKSPAGEPLHASDLATQTAVVIRHIDTVLREFGAGLANVVKLVAFYATDGHVDETAFLTDN